MAEDAFALSPISARPSLPSEADYGAIRDAFMETSRGRWFLDEYAKRNRNADTGMVLDAIAKIEASAAARGAAATSPASLVAMIRPLIDEARATSDAAMAIPEADETIAAGRRASRIIREISWSLRETGTDPRVCNIFDAQLLAIDKVTDLAADDMARAMIGEAFDDLILRVEEIGSGSPAAPREPAKTQPEPVEPVEAIGANLDVPEPAPAGSDRVVAAPLTDMAIVEPPPIAEMTVEELFVEELPVEHIAVEHMDVEQARVEQIAVEQTAGDETTVEQMPTDNERAADDAMLDRIAYEMSAPALDEIDDFDRDDDALTDHHSLAVSVPQPAPASSMPTIAATMIANIPEASPSLGAALIANGIVRARAASAALAPFQRMSQIEKIAFFS